jgi:hypothetical protein
VPLDGGTRGAPDAVQVADRWHLWHNLGEAVERAVSHREHLPAGAVPQVQAMGAATEPEPPPGPGPARTGKIAGRTRARHAEVHRMLAEGSSFGKIASGLGLSRNTVRRFARATSPEELLVHDGTGRRASILGEHDAYLRERWNSGCTNAAQLWQEIRDRGYQGGRTHVRHYLARYRGSASVPVPVPAPPKVRAVTAWIMTRPDRLADTDKASLDAILAASPELAAVAASVRSFAQIMSERRGRKLLEPWMTAALATGEPALRSFVTGLRADQDAVTSGLSLPWSSGAVEGHVNRIKMLKRQMYGRASPDLLRRRVLLADLPERGSHGNCARARIRPSLTLTSIPLWFRSYHARAYRGLRPGARTAPTRHFSPQPQAPYRRTATGSAAVPILAFRGLGPQPRSPGR